MCFDPTTRRYVCRYVMFKSTCLKIIVEFNDWVYLCVYAYIHIGVTIL